MKGLSLKQPFADLLAHGEKTIELRKWNTSFRGEFLIHASKNIDTDACERLDMDINKLTIGSIIGSAYLYDVKEYNNEQEFIKDKLKHFSIITRFLEGYKFGFLVKNAKRLRRTIPYPGKLNFFEVDNAILKNLVLHNL